MSAHRTPEEEVTINVWGRTLDLPGDRKVFLGVDKDGKHSGLFMRFVSPDAGETKLRLSDEAMDALVKLYALHLRDQAQTEVTWKGTWTITRDEDGKVTCEHE